MSSNFVKVASLVPNQHHCNLKLRVLSVEIIAETVHPETGNIIQSAEAIVGDDTACILLNLKNDQVNLLSRNARLQLTNANVNMYRGFMRLEVDEDDEEGISGGNNNNSSSNNTEHGKPSITAIMDDDEDEDYHGALLSADGEEKLSAAVMTTSTLSSSNTAGGMASTTASHPRGMTTGRNGGGGTGGLSTMASGSSSSSSLASNGSSSFSSVSRDQMEVEMRLSTGGSMPLMEYYRTIEFTYFSTVEPVGR
ncbi:hypothetical protein BG004_002338 [Podila humilis]|nr:hypothetical protein BG004_002338 [Podila humilis]